MSFPTLSEWLWLKENVPITECNEASETILVVVAFFFRVLGEFQIDFCFCCALGYKDKVCCVGLNSATEVIRPADRHNTEQAFIQQHT